MIAPDTSVLIAGFDSSHPFFAAAARALSNVRRGGTLIAHTLAEAFAVLTAAGGPYPATGADALAYLDQFLVHDPIGVGPSAYAAALQELSALGIAGGAIYDGLIAIAARDAGAKLVSLDARAARTYARVGVKFSLLS